MTPFSFLDKRLSWHFDSGMYTAHDYGCDHCQHYYAEGGVGGALALAHDRHRLYAMAVARPEVSAHLPRGFRPLLGLDLGILMTPADVYKMRLSVTQYWSALAIHDSSQIFSARFDNSFFPMRNLELRQSNILQSASHQAPALFESRLETVFFFK